MVLKNAISLLSGDVFFHPFWLYFPVTEPAKAAVLIGVLMREVDLLSDGGLWLDSCRAALICAYLQNLCGSPDSALETLSAAHKIARKHHLDQAGIWADWGSAAVCAQNGTYAQAADFLLHLEHDLYRGSQWVLANFISLVRQRLLDWHEGLLNHAVRPQTYEQDEVGLLMERMHGWGKPWLEIWQEAERIWAHQPAPAHQNGSNNGHGIRAKLEKLRRFVRGELRLGLIEVGQVVQPVVDNTVPWHELEWARLTHVPALPSFVNRADQPESNAPPGPPLPPDEPAQPSLIPVTGIMPAKMVFTEPPNKIGHAPNLAIYCLGAFKVFLNNQPIANWNGQKGTSILKYLVANRDRPVAKDILMDLFWPDSETEVARRNLHQAIYGLRQTLRRSLPDLQLILFENDCYRINSEVELWIDFEEFERFVQAGRRQAEAGQAAQAVETFGLAEQLYSGDFLEEELYESWPQPKREYCRSLYLEIAAQISAYYIKKQQITPAMILCQKVLARDHCNERAYRDLILCHLSQGQRQLAMREYQVCVQVLKDELGLQPSEETQELYRQILSG